MDARIMKGSYATTACSRFRNKRLQRLALLAVLALCLLTYTVYEIHVLQGSHLLRPSSAHHEQQPSSGKVLFWTLTVDRELNRGKAAAVADTWARRVDKHLLISNGTELGLRSDNLTLNVVVGPDSRDLSWVKTSAALRYLHARHLLEFEWFMKTDDDTYVLVDRLKRFLADKSPEWPIYYGHKFVKYIKQGYMSGGAGYVLSRRALDLVVREGLDRQLAACRLDNSGVEDLEVGRCLEAVGVSAGSSTDSLGRPTFLPLSPQALLSDQRPAWYADYDSVRPLGDGRNCCSSEPISFHYMTPEMMRLVDWLLYDVKPGA